MNFDLDKSFAVLERTPAVLKALLAGLPEDWTTNNEGPDTWSPFNVVGHLIDGENTDWMERTRIILSDAAERKFRPFDRTRHLDATQGRSLNELLEEFARLRARNLAEVRALGLQPSDLVRTGIHPRFGTVTLEQLLATWVVHDLNHLGQIVRVMGKQYLEAVGPWTEYLPLLQPRRSGTA